MPAAFTIADDGMVAVTIGTTTVHIDAYDCYNRVLELDSLWRDSEKPIYEFHSRVAELLNSLGFGKVSHRAADLFVTHLFAAVDELKKNDDISPTPGSQEPTEPASSTSPPE